jgi:uncharacterized protein YecT (DUF1311 family)
MHVHLPAHHQQACRLPPALLDDRPLPHHGLMRVSPAASVLLVAVGLVVGGCSSSSSGAATTPTTTPSVTSSPSSAGNALPTIPEAFTLLACPAGTPQTTLAMEGCAEHRIVALDKQVTDTAQAVYASLQTASAKQHLVASQTVWIARRRAVCLRASNAYAGGTLSPVVFANCEVRQDRRRLVLLSALQGSASP